MFTPLELKAKVGSKGGRIIGTLTKSALLGFLYSFEISRKDDLRPDRLVVRQGRL